MSNGATICMSLLLPPLVVFMDEVCKVGSPRHCVKSVQIRSFFWTVFSRIRTEYGGLQSI